MKQILMALGIVVMLVVIPPVAIIGLDINVEEEIPTEEITMTVDEFVSLPGDFYYIVKAEGDFGVLESDVYMDREVVEVAVCDDTENTICLFIQLEENEEPHYRKVN
jgi:hypothetical protein